MNREQILTYLGWGVREIRTQSPLTTLIKLNLAIMISALNVHHRFDNDEILYEFLKSTVSLSLAIFFIPGAYFFFLSWAFSRYIEACWINNRDIKEQWFYQSAPNLTMLLLVPLVGLAIYIINPRIIPKE
jgi:hypothetical protein